MDIICGKCATKLSIPDDKLPKGVPSVTGKCPKCQGPIEIRLKPSPQPPAQDATQPLPPPEPAAPEPQPSSRAEEQPAPRTAAPEPQPSPRAEEQPAPRTAAPEPQPKPVPPPPAAPEAPPAVFTDEDFAEGRRLAMACFDSPEAQSQAKAALEEAGYTVHVPSKPEEAVARLRRIRYEVLLLDEAYGGSAEGNAVLRAVQPMAMPLRRHMCVGLVGKELRTLDNMTAFAKSVNFVVAERELGKIKAITRQAVADNDQFYRVFRESLQEAGRV